jgi:nitrate/nitrite transporter NarK
MNSFVTRRQFRALATDQCFGGGDQFQLGLFAQYAGRGLGAVDQKHELPRERRRIARFHFSADAQNVGVVYGWIGVAHQLGASLAALSAGSIRTYLGDYRDAFWLSGGLCLVAATLLISTRDAAQHPEPLGTPLAELA